MGNFEKCMDILERPDIEGGYDRVSNVSSDPGGLTKGGISQKAYPGIDIANLSKEGIQEIARRDYWEPCKCDDLPLPLALCVFDCAFDQGVHTAATLLQRAVGAVPDGDIGPRTLILIHSRGPNAYVERFMQLRAGKYLSLNNATEEANEHGWVDRLISITIEACLIT